MITLDLRYGEKLMSIKGDPGALLGMLSMINEDWKVSRWVTAQNFPAPEEDLNSFAILYEVIQARKLREEPH